MKIRILSYNIHKGFSIGNRDFILENIRAAMREVNADILFLQEVLGDHKDDKCKIPNWQTSIQFEYLADTVWSHFAYGKNAVYDEGHHGNAILSKFPIIDWNNINLSTNRFEQRGLLKVKILIPEIEKEIILGNAHLDLTQRGRNIQTDIIIQEFSQDSDYPWLLVGDFNDWNKKVSKKIESELKVHEAFKFIHGSSPATFPNFLPILSLDRVFVNQLTIISAQTLNHGQWKNLSDHLPLLVEVVVSD